MYRHLRIQLWYLQYKPIWDNKLTENFSTCIALTLSIPSPNQLRTFAAVPRLKELRRYNICVPISGYCGFPWKGNSQLYMSMKKMYKGQFCSNLTFYWNWINHNHILRWYINKHEIVMGKGENKRGGGGEFAKSGLNGYGLLCILKCILKHSTLGRRWAILGNYQMVNIIN